MRMPWIIMGAALVGMPAWLAAAEPAPKIVAFSVGVQVDVDAAGKPVKVEAPQDLPPAIKSFIEKRVASWQYAPAKVGGIAQPAVTYVGVNACAVPIADGSYRLGLDFNGNGPRTAADRRLAPPMYPPLAQRSGTEAAYVLILGIEPDGRAVLDRIDVENVTGRAGASEFEPLLRRWVKTVRFDPERVAGKPVRGKVRMTVSFVLPEASERKAMAQALQAKAGASRECRVAQGEGGMKPVAMESVVTVTPVPAG